MRKVILLTVIAWLGVMNAASGVLALGPESSWSEIRRTPDVIPGAPMIFFGADAVSVTDLCVGGDMLRADTGAGVAAEVHLGSTPRSYAIKVDRVIGAGEHSHTLYLFTKHFEIPVCG